VRGTTTAPALSKHSMAEPMAVSSWNTGAEAPSRGLTVFLFLMSGSGSAPPAVSSVALSWGRLTHRLLVLKKRCSDTSSNAFLSAAGAAGRGCGAG
jgi:hypothetical protein